MTQKQFIINLFSEPTFPELTTMEVTRLIAENFGKKSRYLSGSVSSTLRKLTNDKILFIMKNRTGPRGGYVFKKLIK